MRILYFADIRFPLERANGIQTMETCHALASRGHRVHLIVKPDTHKPARDPLEFYGLTRVDGLVIERATAPAGAGVIPRVGYLSFVLGRAFGRDRADVIVTRDLGVASTLLRIPAGMRAPIVYESHGYAPDVAAALPQLVATAKPPGAAKLRRLARREAAVWRSADGYVTITHGLAAEIARRHGPRERLAVVPDGVRTAGGPPPALPREPRIAYAGHLYAWKGVDVLLKALALTPSLEGVIVGGHEAEPDLGRLRTLAAELGIAERVTFTGLVEPGRVAEHLSGAMILALPNPASAISTRFTSPLKLFEYMAAGRAIVASDLPAIREVLTHDENAWLVEPGSAGALAAGLQRLAEDRPLAERLARTAFEGAGAYTWAKRAERLDALFADVTAP